MVQEYSTGENQVATISSMSTMFSGISEEHVSHTENQTQTIGQQRHDEHTRQNRPEANADGCQPTAKHARSAVTTICGTKCTRATHTVDSENNSRGR